MISPKSLMKIATTASVVAMTVSVAVVPAYAMQDIAIEDTPSSFAATVDDVQNSSNSMPDNPNATLPETVSENISDDSTVVSENLAVTPEGDVQNIETGETVTDAQLVGTQSQQPDPLAKTDGESFIPVSASDVKDAVEQSMKQSVEQSSSKNGATVKLAKFDGNDYGAHWGTYNNTKAFFDYRNNLFAQQAKGVIDVSSWQGDIDWAKAKADGVEGAIIRLGFGWGNDADAKAQRNINECKRLGIPFGIYWYSYAYDANCARAEGNDVAAKLRQMGVSPNNLKYPVYYDLEKWTWAGHTPPTNPNVYSGMADAWYGALQSAGYKNLGVYSYTSYLQGPLNNSNIYAKTRWVAQYGAQMGYNAFGTNDRGWQYTSSGHINGISGSVDMNAFGNKTYAQAGNGSSTSLLNYKKVTDLVEGDYYLSSAFKQRYVDSGQGTNASSTIIWSPSSDDKQLFHVKPVGAGEYTIAVKKTGKVLDVEAGNCSNGARIIQFDQNGGQNQKWAFYRNSAGYMFIASAAGQKNKVIDVTAANSAEGTALELWDLNAGVQQQFRLQQKIEVPRGYSYISSVYAKGMVFDIEGISTSAGAEADIWTKTLGDNQKIKFVSYGNGLYRLQMKHSGLFLGALGTAVATKVTQQKDSDSTGQMWYFRKTSGDKISLFNAMTNLVMDINAMSQQAGAKIICYPFNDQDNQKWTFQSAETDKTVAMKKYGNPVTDLAEGDYYIESAFGNRYLDVGEKNSEKTSATSEAGSNSDSQLFQISSVGNGVYSIKSKSTGKYLVPDGGGSVKGVALSLSGDNSFKGWKFFRNKQGYMFISAVDSDTSDNVIDIFAADSRTGAKVDIWSVNGGSHQQFRLLQKVSFRKKVVFTSSFANGNRLDVVGISPYAGAAVDIWHPQNSLNQRFDVIDKGNGHYALRAAHSGQYLDIYGAYKGDNGEIIQYPANGGLNQQWYMQKDLKGRYALLSTMNNKAIDIYGMNKQAGTRVITYQYLEQENQKWNVDEII